LPCSLELGGNDAAIVLADARLDRAARGIVWAAFTNAGQNCAAIERVYVERAIAEPFIARVVALTKELRPDRDVGPMLDDAQARRVAEQLEQAVALGAVVLTGGAPDQGSRVFAPTVVRVESEASELMTKETFGPILPIVVVENEDDAVDRANNSPYGLTASVWTRRVSHGRKLSQRLRVGVVTINNHAFTAALPMAPWSGVGLTGHGVTNGPYALDGYTRPLFVLADRSGAARELWWYPYTDTLTKLALAMARARGGAGFMGRVVAFFALLMLLPKRLLGDK
jgi:acyl-CoA reductase-like NAD-dependent aldehyde dehydrogenase